MAMRTIGELIDEMVAINSRFDHGIINIGDFHKQLLETAIELVDQLPKPKLVTPASDIINKAHPTTHKRR